MHATVEPRVEERHPSKMEAPPMRCRRRPGWHQAILIGNAFTERDNRRSFGRLSRALEVAENLRTRNQPQRWHPPGNLITPQIAPFDPDTVSDFGLKQPRVGDQAAV